MKHFSAIFAALLLSTAVHAQTLFPSGGSGGGTPGGSDTQCQYNNAGAFGGITGCTTNGTAVTLVAPVLGTPASLTLTNATGLPVAGGGTGLASGTSGGILAFTASGTLASSGALTANLPVIGGGAGVAPSVGTRSGNTTAFVTTTGTQTSGDCVKIDASGNHIANGSACGGGGGTPGGSNTQIQYNNAGAFGGAAGLTTDGTSLTVAGGNLTISGNQSVAAWTTSGVRIKGVAATLTDTTSSGTVAAAYTNVLGGNTIAASSATTFTNYFTTYTNDPVAGTNVTLTNKWALGADSAKIGTSNQLTISTTGVLTATSPVLVTPALGVATGTSIALGGCTISTDELCATGQTTLTGTDGTTALTIAGGTQTGASSPAISATQTWNNAATSFKGFSFTVTQTAALNTSVVMQVGAASTNPNNVAAVLGLSHPTGRVYAYMLPVGGQESQFEMYSGSTIRLQIYSGFNGTTSPLVDLTNGGVFGTSANVTTGIVRQGGGASGSSFLLTGAATFQFGAVTSSSVAVAQTLTVQGSSGASAAAALFTIAGSDQSGTGTTGGAVTLRAGNTSGASGTRTGGALTLAGGTGATVGGAIALQTAATTSLATALGIDAAGLITVPLIGSDATHTTSTLCQDTTTHAIYAGSGTVGICLGTSGRQFKTDFAPMTAGLAELKQINFQNFRYKQGFGDSGARLQYGTTAQDIARVLPNLVGRDANGEIINYDYGGFLFIGLHATQQLLARVERLEAGSR